MPELPNWLRSLPDLWQGNRAIQLLTLVVATIIVARVADWILERLVTRWARRTASEIDDELIARLHGPIYISVLVAGLWLSAKYVEIPEAPARVVLGILATLVILAWLFAAMRIQSLFLRTLGRQGRRFFEPAIIPLLDNLGKVVLIGAGSYFLFIAWKVDPTGWLASAGIAGIAIGFAAKDTLANLFAGVFIFADTPYKIGDFINLDTGERGQVTEIGLRSTRILTRDDVEITIPNAVIANAKIVNESGGPSPSYRIRIQVGVAYGSDLEQIRRILLEVARGHDAVCRDPEPRVRFRRFGASALEHELLCWIEEPVLRGRVSDALNSEVYRRFNAEGVEIPYAKQDVYIKSMPNGG